MVSSGQFSAYPGRKEANPALKIVVIDPPARPLATLLDLHLPVASVVDGIYLTDYYTT